MEFESLRVNISIECLKYYEEDSSTEKGYFVTCS